MKQRIGIIAGGGQFPRLIAQNARESGDFVAVCGFHGHSSPDLAEVADAFCLLHLGQIDKLIAFFRREGVDTLCLAGSINKPKALDLRPDWRAMRLLFKLARKGDDALLRAVLTELESEGFRVIAPSTLAPGLHCPPGQLSRTPPTPEILADIAFAWPIAASLGRYDIGQCLVVREGMVMAVECLEGTDATLRRGGELGGKGCIAVKRCKPGQEERVDLPSVGLETVRLLVDAHYACLALEAGKTLFFDLDDALALADRHGLCVVALDVGGSLPPQADTRIA